MLLNDLSYIFTSLHLYMLAYILKTSCFIRKHTSHIQLPGCKPVDLPLLFLAAVPQREMPCAFLGLVVHSFPLSVEGSRTWIQPHSKGGEESMERNELEGREMPATSALSALISPHSKAGGGECPFRNMPCASLDYLLSF